VSGDQGIVDERLERTAALFRSIVPTTDEQTGASEKAEQSTTKPAARRSREWENRPENKVFSYRTGEDLNQMLHDAVAEYERQGYHTTVSDVMRAWALAGREVWLAGDVTISVTQQQTTTEEISRPT
jgi:hypothetical protein